MGRDGVLVSQKKLPLLRECRERIRLLFNVTIPDFPDSDDLANANGEGTILLWVSLVSPTSTEKATDAKDYILSLIAEGEDQYEFTDVYDDKAFEMVRRERDHIEQTCQAILSLYDDSHEVSICGRKDNVDNAKSRIQSLLMSQRTLNQDKTKETVESNILNMGRVPIANALEIPKPSRRMDIENSIHANNHQWSKLNDSMHDPEGCETSNSSLSFSLDGDDLSEDSSLPSDINRQLSIQAEQDYSDNMRFAMKLGYSENQVKSAVAKLGFNASADLILSEVIKLAENSKSYSSEEEISMEKLYISSELDTTSPPLHGMENAKLSEDSSNLRSIVIDGSNVAMSHGNKDVFSCYGIKLVVQWFQQRGHTDICVFVPQWRKETPRANTQIAGQSILTELERENVLTFTPSRRVQGKRIVPYDDRYILKLATINGGIVVSNDNYRDLVNENTDFRDVVEKRLLMYSFVKDSFMPPDDPFGRRGPTLDNFLRKTPIMPEKALAPCPYGKKCTYGNKCKYYHPERGNVPHKSVSEKLQERVKAQEKIDKGNKDGDKKKSGGKKPWSKMALTRTQSLVPTTSETDIETTKKPVTRTESDTANARQDSVPTITVAIDPVKLEEERMYNERLSLLRKQTEAADAETNATTSEPYLNGSNHPSPGRPERLISGYLALAKKLSDESDDDRYLKERGPRSKPSPLPFTADSVCGHAKVSRQFSLQGPQDPRLRPEFHQMYSVPANDHGLYLPHNPNRYVQHTGEGYSRSMSHQGPIRASMPLGYFNADNRYLSVDNSTPFSSNYNSTPFNNQGYMAIDQNEHFLSDPTQYLTNPRAMAANSGPAYVNHQQAKSCLPYAPETAYENLDGYIGRSSGIQSQRVVDVPYAQLGHYPYQHAGMPVAPPVMQNNKQTSHVPSTPTMLTPTPTATYYNGNTWTEPHPYTQTRYPDDTPIEHSDERYILYYNLCNLYNEQLVRAVMNRHPEERDVQIISGYITSLSY